MKLRIIYMIFLVLGALFLMSSKDGRADSQNWGNTGAPGDQLTTGGDARTCISCHNSSALIGMSMDVELFDAAGALVSTGEYTPGETYRVKVTMNVLMGSPSGFGFQILCLNAEEGVDGPEVSEWENPSSNVKIATAGNTNRTYAEHSGVSESNVFEVDWVAPAVGTGVVTFYSCGNGVNGNNATGGDGAACTTVSFAEAITNPVAEVNEANLNLAIAPNPAKGFVNVSFDNEGFNGGELIIMDAYGKQISYEKITEGNAGFQKNLNTANWSTGIYFVQLKANNQQITRRLLIQD